MSFFKLLDYNWCFNETVAITPTSEDVNFPATNLRHQTRSKVWRSSGYFQITSTNKYIDFKEGAGSELTAIITEGNYTVDALEAEIKLQMEAVGALTHTCSFSRSTGLWTFSVSTSTIDLLTDTGSNAANSIYDTLGFDESADYTGDDSHTGVRIALHTVERVVFDLISTEPIDTVVLLFDKSDGTKLTNAAVVKVKASATPNFDVVTAVDETVTIDDQHMNAFVQFDPDVNYRYWCVEITDPENTNLYVELPMVFISNSLQLSRNVESGFEWITVDQTDVLKTDYGHVYTDVYPMLTRFGIGFKLLEDTDVYLLQDMFELVGKSNAICFILDPDEECGFDTNRMFVFGNIVADWNNKHEIRTRFNVDFDILERI